MARTSRQQFVRLLQNAHAGERAAAFAYQGHARSVRSPVERDEISQIEADEWRHRAGILRMLTELGEQPRLSREWVMMFIGTFISWFCRVGGWFLPMYGAGKLERGNIAEYEVAAQLAVDAGHPEYVDELLEMAEVEWDHELYFRTKAASHFGWRWFPTWAAPPPRETIRGNFDVSRQTSAPRESTRPIAVN